MKTIITKAPQVSTQSKFPTEQVSLNKPYVLWSKTNRVDLLNLEVIDGFLRENMMLHFSKQVSEQGSLIIEFERIRSTKLNNYFTGEILQDLTGIQNLLVRVFENRTLVSETLTVIKELN